MSEDKDIQRIQANREQLDTQVQQQVDRDHEGRAPQEPRTAVKK